MNKDYIKYNLNEALDQISNILKDLETQDDYGIGEFSVDIQHTFHHINTAWNARNSSESDSAKCSERLFYKWRDLPKDIYMGE